MSTVVRFDRGAIRKPERTPNGFLRVDGYATRVGVLLYRNADGTERRELRHPDEVFKANSLATLAGVPVTDLHPAGLVTPENVTSLQRGFVRDAVEPDGDYVRASMIVQDAGMIAAIEGRQRSELSCGYTCVLDATPGEWRGQRYDAIQRGIVYNHVGVGPRGWGRAGSEVALKLDGADVRLDGDAALGDFIRQRLELAQKTEQQLAEALGVDAWAVCSFLDGWWDSLRKQGDPATGLVRLADVAPIASFLGLEAQTLFDLVPVASRGDGGRAEKPKPQATPARIQRMEPKIIRVDGIDYKVDEAAAPHITKALADRDAKLAAGDKALAETQAKADAAAARADGLTKEIETLKAKLDAAESPERLSKLVSERVALETRARAILGEDAKLDGKSEGDIKLECIKKVDAKFDSAGKSAAYVDARFDMIDVEAAQKQARSDAGDEAARAAARARRADTGTAPDPEAARQKMMQDSREAGRKPLGAHKE